MRQHRERGRELTEQEVYVPPVRGLPEEWERNNSLFNYRLIRRSGWAGKTYLLLVLLMLLFGSGIGALFGSPRWLSYVFVIALEGCLLAIAVVVVVRTYGRRRRNGRD